jgi:hypothetical protein
MYIRFGTTRVNEDSHEPGGIFTAAYLLLDSGELTVDERTTPREILDWFNKYLAHPPERFTAGRAIFWFKSTAQLLLAQVWEIVHMLRLHGYHVEIHKCRHLANICWQDTNQAAAYPSPLDSRITIQ